MKISIIIPVYNEENYISETLSTLREYTSEKQVEIIVVDSGSEDRTKEIVRDFPVTLMETSVKCRAVQMNRGVSSASGEVLYFLHADAIPPEDFIEEIENAIRSGYEMGIFSYEFDSDSQLLKFNAWFNQFDGLFTGGGDQSLFIERAKFEELDGYREDHLLMEDFEFYKRAKKKLNHTIIRNPLTVSARKYENNSWLRVQVANFVTFSGYHIGLSQKWLCKFYGKALK